MRRTHSSRNGEVGTVHKHAGCASALQARVRCAHAQVAQAPQVCASQLQSVLNAAKSECSRVSSLADFERSPCILPAAE